MIIQALSILLIAIIPVYLYKKIKTNITTKRIEALATGLFLGIALIHQLAESFEVLVEQEFNFPAIIFVIGGLVFLFFLLLEHIGVEVAHKNQYNTNNLLSILAVILLSVHSIFAGAGLSIESNFTVQIGLLLSILVHKFFVSLSLVTLLNNNELPKKYNIILFAIFACMAPLGVIIANIIITANELIPAFIGAISGGTFLYLGTLHGLEKALMIKQCCNLKTYFFVIIGFIVATVLALVGG